MVVGPRDTFFVLLIVSSHVRIIEERNLFDDAKYNEVEYDLSQ